MSSTFRMREFVTSLAATPLTGFVLRDSWSTDNTLTTEATLSDPFGLEGFTFGVENEFKPNTK